MAVWDSVARAGAEGVVGRRKHGGKRPAHVVTRRMYDPRRPGLTPVRTLAAPTPRRRSIVEPWWCETTGCGGFTDVGSAAVGYCTRCHAPRPTT